MQAAIKPVSASAHVDRRQRRWPVWISRVGGALFVFLYFFLYPMCYCPHYYLELSVFGLLPLLCGPWLYRYLGLAIIVAGLLTAEADRRGLIRERQQIRDIRARVEAEALRVRSAAPH
jgi:hypothetical protein